jgi:exodeoxyribonuclease VII large subunit
VDGLLDRPRRALPRLPVSIGVVCGTEAAVRADIESVVAARFPGYPVRFLPTNVSGPGAADAIGRSLTDLDLDPDVSVIVLARGGGDTVQMLPWSDEALCRAVAACSTPVVSAIGHDADRPLCDEVADLRCGTPSLAAAAVIPARAELWAEVDGLAARAEAMVERRLSDASASVAALRPERALDRGLAVARGRCERASGRLALVHPRRRVAGERERLAAERRHLDALSPARVLERGFAVVRAADGSVVRDASAVAVGSSVDVQLATGSLAARVEDVRP